MDLVEVLPAELCLEILSFLSARELSAACACSRAWRSRCCVDTLWIRHCAVRGWLKYGNVPLDLTTSWQSTAYGVSSALTSPTYRGCDQPEQSTLAPLPKWRRVFLRAHHLAQNWAKGRYNVLPVLKGHKGKISAMSCNGRLLVSASDDKQLLVWDLAKLVITHEISGHADCITAVQMMNASCAVTGCADGSIRVVDITTGRIVSSIRGQASVESLKMVGTDMAACVHGDRTIRLWNIQEQKLCSILHGHTDDIECMEVFGRRILSGSWDCTLMLWDTGGSDLPLMSLRGHEEVVYCCQFNDHVAVSGSGDGTVRVWQLVDGSCGYTLRGHKQEVHCVAFNDEALVSGGSDSLIIVWSWDGETRHVLHEHIGVVRCLHLNSDRLVSGGDRKRIAVWDYRIGKCLQVLHRQPSLLYLMWCNETLVVTASPESPGTMSVLCHW